ncbi:Tryprostatin B 6-hydroxylase [Ascochyta rabiei]|uniref:Tryprostatin B 6-hydroxylase n=1 Tax=Didymella rabiei TaxID=5454 RepID=UPI00220637C3|nr:Tryprostatin B 6-hydroxylase [Ascochyta rabiei]UPX19180.1 Tryprostatin B 6-hydroxylase [Ascochyta rabiei]
MAKLVDLFKVAHSPSVLAFLGLFTHLILHRDEWDNNIVTFLWIWLLGFSGIATVEYIQDPRANTIGAVVKVTATAAGIYFTTLSVSVLAHRVLFHRLRTFPGPFIARFSKLHAIFAGVLPSYQYYKYSETLHKKYQTDVIRTGPRELAVYCADAVPLIHGPTSRCRKGTWYDSASHISHESTHATRDKLEHKQRRKAWEHALSAKALREYEPRVNRHALALMARLKEEAKTPSVRITNWVNFYSFDVMGDIGFSRSFGMVEKGEEDAMITLLHASMEPMSVFGHLPWALNLITRTAVGAKPLIEHINWTAKVLQERKAMTPKENDIFSRLIDPESLDVTPELNAESRLLVIAGSGTTAITLSFIAYELCKNPQVQAKLRKKLDAAPKGTAHLDVEDVQNTPYLDGVINEAMRLHPVVPSGFQRETPPEGITLPNGTYIPGNIHIWMPMHCLQRDPRYFAEPLTFLPERWTDEQPDAVIDKRAFLPFSTGVYNCVGQKLALMELRSVTANLVREFEFGFAEGEDGSAVEKNGRDCFTHNTGKLDVKLTPRYV